MGTSSDMWENTQRQLIILDWPHSRMRSSSMVLIRLMKNKYKMCNFNIHWRRVLRKILNPLKAYEFWLCISQK